MKLLVQLLIRILLAWLSSSIFRVASSPLDPLVILKLTKLFDWLHDPLLQLFAHILLARLSSSIFRGGGGGGGGASPPWAPTYTETNKTVYMAAWSTTSYLLAFPCLGYLRQYSGGLHVKGQKCLVVHRDRTPPPPPPLPHRHPR